MSEELHRWADQELLDADREERQWTGYALDLVTHDYCVYVGGRIVGWAKDSHDARKLLGEATYGIDNAGRLARVR